MNDIVLNSKSKTYLFLKTNNNQYMVDSENVSKIIILQNLECPATLPKHVMGLLEYEDDYSNVLDLRSLLGLEIKPYPINSKIIIINYKDTKFALLTEDVLDIRRVKPSLIKDAPYNKSEVVHQIYSPKNDLNTMIISIDSIYNILKKSLEENIFEDNKTNLLPETQNAVEILKQRALSIKQRNELKNYTPVNVDNQYTTFEIENAKYSLKSKYIKEFFKLNKTKITHIPSTPDFIKGIINIKGDFICVLDIQKYFNRGEIPIGDKSNVIVLESDKVKLGILTNGISKNMSFENIEFNSNDYVDVVQNDNVYCILNVENIINNEKILVK